MGHSSWTANRVGVGLVVLIVLLCCCATLIVAGIIAWSRIAPQPDLTPSLVASPTATALSLRPTVPPPSPTPVPSPSRASIVGPLATDTVAPTRTLAPTATLTPSATPSRSVSSPSAESKAMEERLRAAEMPQRDIRLLAEHLKKVGPIPEVVRETPLVYQVGDKGEFWVGNTDTMEQFQVTAVLRYVTPHLYVWVEEGLHYDQAGLARSAENFEAHVYPTDREFFGSEWSPGVDSDPHLHILHSSGEHMGDGVAGYYSSADEYSHLANPYSNEREMFYVSLDGVMAPGTDFYDGVLAHEFQHMIHWANDRNEETWVNEGCSELAAYLNGYDPGGFDWLFVADPDVQLNTWAELGDSGPHYGNSYLFMAYFLGRFGEETLKRVVSLPENGSAGFDVVLADYGLTFDQVFGDWLVANYLDNLAPAGNGKQVQYTYPDHIVGPVAVDEVIATYPAQRASTVHQYAADYVQLEGSGDLRIQFSGETEAKLVPVDAHSGTYAWWSNRGDDSDATLTRSFDLRSLEQATMQVWMWYDIEEDWDYGYVQASADGGQTWDVLPGPSTTTRNPNGNSFGTAYTGESNGWIKETFDLAPYAGHEVLVRFEYVTDDAVNLAGWLIDDIRIPELGYVDDMELGETDWQSSGFVYSGNRVSQRYLVRLIAIGDQLQVLELPLDEMQQGQIELRGLGQQIDSAILVISALAPVTTEVANYQYVIQPLNP
jgi:immune inhibitor A